MSVCTYYELFELMHYAMNSYELTVNAAQFVNFFRVRGYWVTIMG